MSTEREVELLWHFWTHPLDGNTPEDYLKGEARTELLMKLIKRLQIPKQALILEIGCSSGRNLSALHKAGYHNIAGVDINPNAEPLMRKTYPHLKDTTFVIGMVEDLLPHIRDAGYDLIFSIATLQHLSMDSTFKEIARCTNKIITIEDEKHQTPIHFPRNYQQVFEPLGFKQLYSLDYTEMCSLVPTMGEDEAMDEKYVARVFQRAK